MPGSSLGRQNQGLLAWTSQAADVEAGFEQKVEATSVTGRASCPCLLQRSKARMRLLHKGAYSLACK